MGVSLQAQAPLTIPVTSHSLLKSSTFRGDFSSVHLPQLLPPHTICSSCKRSTECAPDLEGFPLHTLSAGVQQGLCRSLILLHPNTSPKNGWTRRGSICSSSRKSLTSCLSSGQQFAPDTFSNSVSIGLSSRPSPWRLQKKIRKGSLPPTASAGLVPVETENGPEADSIPQLDEPTWDPEPAPFLGNWKPPRYLWRGLSAILIAGQVVMRVLKGKIHWKNTLQQLQLVGPGSLGVALLTASFVGMVFTIQFVREFARLGLTRSVGGVLALALSRELSPVITAIILAGRVGSAFAAELGTMQVSEQTDTLRVLRTDPVDYLVTPRVLACCLAMPVLTLMCFAVGMAASVLLADGVYGVTSNIILDSAARALRPWDIISTLYKSFAFGGIVSVISCAWGMTTLGGAKGVGESTTSAVVISLVFIFIADFVLSYCFFQGAGDSLKAAVG